MAKRSSNKGDDLVDVAGPRQEPSSRADDPLICCEANGIAPVTQDEKVHPERIGLHPIADEFDGSNMNETVQILVEHRAWDLTVRLAHWTLVLSFAYLAITGTMILNDKYMAISGTNKIMMKSVHVYGGYVLGASLLALIAWGFVGGLHSRWSRILPLTRAYWSELLVFLRSILDGRTIYYIGLNPLGRMMVTLLVALLLAQTSTGLVIGGADVFAWPFGGYFREWIAATGVDPTSLVPGSQSGVDEARYKAMRAFRSPFRIVHEWTFYALAVLVPLHIGGVVWTEMRDRVAIVSGMITGRKVLPGLPVDESSED